MKKITFLPLLIVTFLSLNSFAQEENVDAGNDSVRTDLTYNKGDMILQAGLSLAYYGYGYVGSRTGFTVPISGSFEYGIHEDISGGPFFGFARWSYDWDYSYSWTFTSIGVRGSFHYLPYLNEILEKEIDASKFDFYLTLITGLEIRTYSTNNENYTDYYENDVNLIFGPVAGLKYYFNQNFSAFFEGGRGALGYGKIGVSVKF